jgi:restriction system protein
MGRILARHSYFLDVASEEVACSSGVLLTDNNIKTLSLRYHIEEFQRLQRSDRETTMRAEEFEEAVLNIRKAIGNLPDAKMGQFVLCDAVRELHEQGADTVKIAKTLLAVGRSGKYGKRLGEEAIDEIIATSGQKPLHVLKYLGAFSEMQRRQLFYYSRVSQYNWDGAVSLNRLFEGEHVPDDPTVYLDQRYIDYLAKNSEEMGRIHWRNFERLTTEFFRRQGYEVVLGKGSKDGGIDVRVWTDKDAKTGPPLMLIQCKRYKNVVGIDREGVLVGCPVRRRGKGFDRDHIVSLTG